ncbi:MAG: hypothetical protein CL714_00825 [Chloroflexi bacterium]|nr:hypothetical protein [Chloroflexota bacterium]MBR91830.1 hypothetical protein [Dehalococcoidia bacterium]MQG09025.1 YggT family protein [SAR202 cluster bacterium]|tara:strand:+ start:4610 stop:4855 length:246 start_codon:yes stop_codon:yes gene_type:complete
MIIISDLLSILLRIYAYLIIIRAFSTWFPQFRNHEIVQTLYKITDPIMKPASKYIPPIGMIDISAMVVVIVLLTLSNALRY